MLLVIQLFISSFLNAQNQNAIWCFGDSSGIDFSNINNPIPIISSMDGRGSCVSISDSNAQLLFYANTAGFPPGYATLVWNRNNQIMQNGDSLVGEAWYNELLIIRNPAQNDEYYLFSVGVAAQYGYYYSIIDLNGGLGAITLKNIQLDSFPAVDCVTAIKHGNGRDWWVLVKRSAFPFGGSNNEWHEYLVTPAGIIKNNVQQIGVPFSGNAAKLCVNPQGDKIAFTHFDGLVETYDFDRCSGIISNAHTIEYPNWPTVLYPCNECAFSPSGNNLYVTLSDTFSALIQYNLLDTNPALTKDTLWYYNFPVNGIGAVRRAPDNKLYVTSAYYNGFTWNYPYPDSMYNVYNMNLSVINYPDSLGAACDFQPYSFYLGGKRTYWGLPNNPDYDLGKLVGSPCDTIQYAGISNIEQGILNAELKTTYISAWQKLFVNVQHIKGRNCVLKIFDVNGSELYSSSKQTVPPYYTQDVDVGNLSSGLYLVSLITDKELLSAKFVKN